MIVDDSEEFRHALEMELSEDYAIIQCCNGKEALSAAVERKPEIIVLDLMLTGLDGITLLGEIRTAGLHPMVMAVTRFYTDYVLEMAQELGIGYIMRKPCDIAAVGRRVRDLSRHLKPLRTVDPRACIAELTRAMMFSPRHQGTRFLQEAVLIAMERPHVSMTKDLYPSLGRQFGSSYHQVEHALRTAITTAFRKSDGAVWDELFPPDAVTGARQLSNGAVIATLAEWLRGKMESERRSRPEPSAQELGQDALRHR